MIDDHVLLTHGITLVLVLAPFQMDAAAGPFRFEPFREVLLLSGEYPTDVELGDLNGDGKLDIVVTVLPQDPTAGRIMVLLNRGQRVFDAPVSYPTLGWVEFLALGDLDGDADLDIVTAYGWYGPTQVSAFLGRGDGTFGPSMDADSGGKTVRPAIGDLDGDGRADIVLATPQANGVTVLRGNGDGSFAAPSLQPAGPYPWDVVIAHLNSDAWLDLAVPCEYLHGVAILLGTGGGAFAPPQPYYTGKLAYTIEAGDVNNDGATDLAITSFEFHTVAVLRGRGDGTFGGKRDYTSHDRSDISGDPDDVAIGDLDGDAWQDLAVVNRLSSTVVVNLNRADGSFTRRQTYGCGMNPGAIRLGDLDDDGILDAVLPNAISSLSILYGSRSSAGP